MKQYKRQIICIILFLLSLAFGINIAHANNVTHTHIWATKYDSTNHWEYCTVCGEKRNEKAHSYTDHWILGYESCSRQNYSIRTCDCGYSYTYRKSHTPPNPIVWKSSGAARAVHYYSCTSCGNWINSGKCYNASGTLSCKNPGTCTLCGTVTTSSHHFLNGNGKCDYCGIQFFSSTSPKITYSSNYATATVVFTVKPERDDVTISGSMSTGSVSSANWSNVSYSSVLNNDRSRTFAYVYTFNPNLQRKATIYVGDITGAIVINGVNCYSGTGIAPHTIWQDHTVPVISKIEQRDQASANGWATIKELTISGTENLSDIVYITISDKATGEKYITDATVTVTDGSYSYQCTPAIEGDASGRTYVVTVKDKIGNTSVKDFLIIKTDASAPKLKTGDSLNYTSWTTTEKQVNLNFFDFGSGTVMLSFNNQTSYEELTKNGEYYPWSKTFSNEQYGTTNYAIYVKDALGNARTYTLVIGNIDKTPPTITNTDIDIKDKITLTVTANDNKDFGGSVGVKSGSGIAGYAVSKTNSTPSTFQTSNKLTITEDGNYYLFVKDNAGNVTSKNLGYLKPKGKITINHYFINKTTRNYPSTPSSTLTTYREIGSEYVAPKINISGYKIPSAQTIIVSASGNTINYYYDVPKYTVYTYIDGGYGALSEDQLVEPNKNTSIYYYPANGYDVEYVKIGTNNSNIADQPIDILKVFENVSSDYYVHVKFGITQTKISEITKEAYNWIDLKITHSHAYSSTITVNPTCVTKGNLYNKCKVCNLEYYDTIPATGHLYTLDRYIIDIEPTCTTVGSKSLHCDICNTIIDGTEVVITALGHNYSSTYTVDRAATCTETGSKSQHCSRCSLTTNVTTIPATGHNYKAPNYSWAADGSSCTATRVCTNNSNHKETESGTITNRVKSNPSCGVNGVTTYTATFNNTAFTTQTKDIADIPKTSDHNFSNGKCTICGTACPGKMVIYAVDGPHDMDSTCLRYHTDHCDCSSARCIHFDQWDGRATYDAYGKYSVQTGHWCNSMGESGTTRYRKTYFRCTTCGKTSSTTSYCSTKYKSCATGNFVN